jgi:hypothetical protein
MTLFRARAWGSADWCTISIAGEVEEVCDQLAEIICEALGSADNLHIQQMNEDGEWEDLE